MFKGVLFDLDGILTDTAEYHYQAWKKLGQKIGIPIDRKFNEQLKGVSRNDSLKLLLEKADRVGEYNSERLQELATCKNNYYLEMIKNIGPEDVYPGILTLLKELKGHGIKVSLASASKNGPLLLGLLKLNSFFDGIADPEKIAFGKPKPDIFLLAAKNINVRAEECIGIEDAIAGVQAIQSSGAMPIGVGKTSELGDKLNIVPTTEKLTYDYLVSKWEDLFKVV